MFSDLERIDSILRRVVASLPAPSSLLPDPAGCRHPDPHAWLADGTVMCRMCGEELGVRAE